MLSHYQKFHADKMVEFRKNSEYVQSKRESNRKKRKADVNPYGHVMKQQKLNADLSLEGLKVDKDFQKGWDDKLCEFVAKTQCSFAMVASEPFQELIGYIQNRAKNARLPPFKLKSRFQVSRDTSKMVQEVKKLIVLILDHFKGQIPAISFTTDIWSSRKNESYVSLSAHFCSENMELIHLVPFCAYFPVSHSGANIKVEIDRMIQELRLNYPELSKYVIHDNASNAKKAFKLHEYLEQLFCLNHTMELALGDSTKATVCDVVVSKCMKKAHTLAVKVRKSHKLTEELKKSCSDLQIKFTTLKPSVKTRWNSSYINISSVIRLKDALVKLFSDGRADSRWAVLEISSIEWRLLQGLEIILGKFSQVSKVRSCS